MKVTRFINGNKIREPFLKDMVVKSEVVSRTIDNINRRLKSDSDDILGKGRNG